MSGAFWRLAPTRAGGRGPAVPSVGGAPLPDGGAIEARLGGGLVVGVLVVVPGDLPLLSVHFTDEEGGSTGQQMAIPLPYGALVRPVPSSRLPATAGDGSAAFAPPEFHEGPADPQALAAAEEATKNGGAWVEAPGGSVPLSAFLAGAGEV